MIKYILLDLTNFLTVFSDSNYNGLFTFKYGWVTTMPCKFFWRQKFSRKNEIFAENFHSISSLRRINTVEFNSDKLKLGFQSE